MCMLFAFFDNNPEDGKYQLILANNRDEYYQRPTHPACNWENSPECIGGLDLEPERKGGTWFGLSTNGKIGTLLNILQPSGPDPGKRARGHLVTDFLTSEKSAEDFIKPLIQYKEEYNDFNLLLFEKQYDWKLTYFSNLKGKPEILSPGVHVVGNSVMDKPWQKAVHGKQIFMNILKKYNKMSLEEELIAELINMLNDSRQYLPDPQLQAQCGTSVTGKAIGERSAVFVDSPEIQYGTRTNTVILLDKEGFGEYIERTMKEPIDSNHIEWDTNRFPFTIKAYNHVPE